MKNPYFDEIQGVFRKRIQGWNEVPEGDPVKVMAEALATSLLHTDTRYRQLLDHVVDCIPSMLGFRRRAAHSGTVSIRIAPSAKLKSPVEIPVGTLFPLKNGDSRYEVKTLNAAFLNPAESVLINAEIVEVIEDRQLGFLQGTAWERVSLPANIVEEPELLTVRFPDETLKTLTRFSPDALLQGAGSQAIAQSFLCSVDHVTIPAADKHVAGYRALVRVHATELRLATDVSGLVAAEFKYAGEKGAHVADVVVERATSAPLPAESTIDFQKRFQLVQQQALAAFHGSLAQSTEEITSLLADRFPTLKCTVEVDTETETLFVYVPESADALFRRQVRHAVEAKVSLRFEVVVAESQAALGKGKANVH